MGMELAMNEVGIYEMADGYFSDSEVVIHVRDALKSVVQGDDERYNQLIEVMDYSEHIGPDQEAMLVTSLRALTGAVSHIDIVHHGSLLSSIFGMSMWNYGRDVMDAYMEFIISLAASNGKILDASLEMLVGNFLPPKSWSLARKEAVVDRVHMALSDISDLVPLAPLRLMPIILWKMPHTKSNNKDSIVLYVENMLRLESGPIGELVGSTMLMAVMDRLIDLDVEIAWDDILQEDFSKGIFDMELEDVEATADDAGENGSKLPDGTLSRQNLRGNAVADRLDSLMVLTCEHLKSCADGGRLVKVFETLCQSFQITVLNAYKSKFAQFVVFYTCSLDPENCGVKFAVLLADIFVCRDYPPLTRMSAVAYLASYLARGRFLPSSLVASMLKRLVDWCFEYCQIWVGEEKTVKAEAHRVFYSACQAVMYVLCFRMRSLMDIPHFRSQLFHMPLQTIFRHPLDPLKVCLPSIVEEFLKQAKAALLFTVSETFLFSDLLESELSKAFGGMERFDMFFPFDPCLLKGSDRFIRPNYMFWSMVKTTYDDDEEEDDEDLDEEDDFAEEEALRGMAESYEEHDFELDEFEHSMNKMSITPRNSFKHGFASEIGILSRMPARIRPSTSPW